MSGQGLQGDRSCSASNVRQVLLMDRETLDELDLKPGEIKENITVQGLNIWESQVGQVFLIGDQVTMEVVEECEACAKMDEMRPGLKDKIDGKRGMLAMVINGGPIKVGDSVRTEP